MQAIDLIPFFSSRTNDARQDLLAPVKRVLESHWYVLGQEVDGFEKAFAEYCGVHHCVSVANGTDALELGLRALGVQPGDKVVTAANAGFYSSTAIRAIGAVPHYVDVNPATLTLDVGALREALTVQPKAVIVTHLYGQLAEIEQLVGLAEDAGVPVLEDCAQAHGAQRHGKRAGSFGKVACFSFYPTKNLGALGDGGAIVTADEATATQLKQLRQYGWSGKYHVDLPGGRNSRLDEIQAAVLRDKLLHLDEVNALRRAIARRYNAAFSDLPLRLPVSVDEDYVAHLYVVRVRQREAFRQFLGDLGIATDVHYPVPDHHQVAYPSERARWHLPHTTKACEGIVSLPCHPGLTEAQILRIIDGVRQYFAQTEPSLA